MARREICDIGPVLFRRFQFLCFVFSTKNKWQESKPVFLTKGINVLNGSAGRQWRWRDYCRRETSAYQRVASEQALTGTSSFFSPLTHTEVLITRRSQVGRSQGNLQIKWQVSACLHWGKYTINTIFQLHFFKNHFLVLGTFFLGFHLLKKKKTKYWSDTGLSVF